MILFSNIFGGSRRGCCVRSAPVRRICGAVCGANLVKVTKSADYYAVKLGEEVEVRLDVTNDAAVPMQVWLEDALMCCAIFVPDSMAVNGIAMPDANPILGMNLGALASGETVTVHYRFIARCSACSVASVWYSPQGTEWQAQILETSISNTLCVAVEEIS